MVAVDFFCGAGGLSKGLELAGIKVLAGIDNNILCKETYDKNNSPAIFINADMREFTPEILLEKIPELREVNPADLLLAGCAPCQPFSQANQSEERSPDATLLSQFSRFVEHFLPGQVMIENVPGLARVKGNSTFKRFLNLLDKHGYKVIYKPVNAKYYGVPQNRVRLLVLAVRNAEGIVFPEQTHFLKPEGAQKRLVTVRDVIAKFPPISAGEKHQTIANHVAARLEEKNIKRLQNTPHDGGSRTSWSEDLILDCHSNGHKGHTDVYGRMFWDKPSPTLTCKCQSISNGRYGHPEQDRGISLREAAALQSFPDDYIFYGSNTSIAAQIGNAVPVQLGKVMGEHFIKIREEIDQDIVTKK